MNQGLLEQFKQAKANKKFILKRSYFNSDISWDNALSFIYKESSAEEFADENKEFFTKNMPEVHLIVTVKGNVSVHDPLWIKSLTGRVWKEIPQLKEFLIKLNNDFDNNDPFDDCEYYKGTLRRYCDCKSLWHTEGMVVSLASRLVSEHRDVFDAGYIQILGDSYWKIEGQEDPVVMGPGDLLLLPNELTHEVWGEGPRMGILLYYSQEDTKQ